VEVEASGRGFSQILEKAFPWLQPNWAEAGQNLFFLSSAKAALVDG
jgi:hypothetical protein